MKARLYNSPKIQELMDEITPEEMEATKQQMLKEIEMENKTPMMQLLAQLRDERKNMPLNIEWDRCYQAIEMVIENTYIPLERKHIEKAFDFEDYNIDLPDGTWEQKYKSPEQYYNEVYKNK